MNNLGDLQSVHKVQRQSKIVAYLIVFFIFGFGALFFGNALANEENPVAMAFLLAMLGIFLLLCGILLKGFIGVGKQEVCLYENGLVCSTKKFIHTFEWEEIESVSESVVQPVVNGIPARKVYSYTVKTQDGNQFIVGSVFKDIEKIGERLTNEVFKRRMPEIIGKFNRGETVKFGRFSINQSCLFSEKRGQLPLSHIKSIDVFEGTICISKKDKILSWDTAKYDSIPNARILLAIWEGIR